ncbi:MULTISPECIES: LysR family transcriptional regulator [Xenorhabdus]|uniref:LysR family transcriptional regulator n=1 Tax=Xenorhabdus TaxID=626 RepID=UPI00064B4580|nr:MULTISPECIES: LysR family transcriptional regulator [Xenorhabdus]KLU17243.1 LysR family transcriptional regulator [Xenorhabdus griffiniae]KOP33193.1 LysR family transcriptional regulator [Xenorhabdus sp. GDc328]WFQ78997.1 LysR family transcriptional regulator [Xenorhabdus sp. SF857]
MALSNLDDLVTFLTVIDSNSFSAAARIMNKTPSSVSKQIARLEAALNVSLFERNTRMIKITDEGTAIAKYVRTALSLLENIYTIDNKGNNNLEGNIKITAPVAFGEKYITKEITSFIDKYPRVNFDLQLTDRIIDIYSNKLDLAIRFGQLADSQLIATPLAVSERILVASPKYMQGGTISHPNELKNHNCLLFSYPGLFQHTWSLNKAKEQIEITVSGNLRSDNSHAIKAWCLAGLGIALREKWDVKDEIATGKLVRVLPDWKEKETMISIIRARREPIPQRVRSFIEHLTYEWINPKF